MKELINDPIQIASTLIGIVITSINISNGALEKSTFIKRSDLPTAFNIFILIDDNGVNILARNNHCIKTTQGNHLSVNSINTIGRANRAHRIIIGNITIAVKNNAFL